jgi:thiol-disulfide isomerase/thioredoxin
MRPAIALLVAALAALPAAAEIAGAPLEFAATTLDGAPVSGQSLAGRWVLLDFWGTWCAPCVAVLPRLDRLQREERDRLAVVGLAFYSGSGADVAAFLDEQGAADYVAWLGEEPLLEKFGILAFPTYFLIAPGGTLVFEQIGELPDIVERVEAVLETAASPARAATRR